MKVANTWWIAGFLLSAQLLFAQSVKPAAAPKTSPAPKTSAPQAAKPAQPAPPPPKPSASGSTASQEKSEDQTKPEVSAPTQEEEPVPGGKRRDPFRTLIEPKKPDASPIALPPGKKGLVIEQLLLQGIARAVDGSWIAVVDNKTKRAYFLHQGDQLYNGTVTRITQDRVVFTESISELGRTVTREIVRRMSGE